MRSVSPDVLQIFQDLLFSLINLPHQVPKILNVFRINAVTLIGFSGILIQVVAAALQKRRHAALTIEKLLSQTVATAAMYWIMSFCYYYHFSFFNSFSISPNNSGISVFSVSNTIVKSTLP